MKTSFTYNLLKHLRTKKEEGGFTLIELLVVIIIIGILAAIALPSFLNQANRARETEASNGVGALNRGQQAFYLEAVNYAQAMADLDVGVDPVTENFVYRSDGATAPKGDQSETVAAAGSTTGVGIFGLSQGTNKDQAAVIYASPVEGIRGFAGVAYVETVNDKNVTGAALCRENAADAKTAGIAKTVTPDGTGKGDNKFCGTMEGVN